MLRFNPIRQPAIITPDEVVFFSQVDYRIDSRAISPSISLVGKSISDILGNYEYNKFILYKNIRLFGVYMIFYAPLVGGVVGLTEYDYISSEFFLPENYLNLWYIGGLGKLASEFGYWYSSQNNYMQLTTSGVLHNNPKGPFAEAGRVNETVPLSTLRWENDKQLLMRINPLLEAFYLYVSTNNWVNIPTKLEQNSRAIFATNSLQLDSYGNFLDCVNTDGFVNSGLLQQPQSTVVYFPLNYNNTNSLPPNNVFPASKTFDLSGFGGDVNEVFNTSAELCIRVASLTNKTCRYINFISSIQMFETNLFPFPILVD